VFSNNLRVKRHIFELEWIQNIADQYHVVVVHVVVHRDVVKEQHQVIRQCVNLYIQIHRNHGRGLGDVVDHVRVQKIDRGLGLARGRVERDRVHDQDRIDVRDLNVSQDHVQDQRQELKS
jgi:hypothetical protein